MPPKRYIPRTVDDKLFELILVSPAVAIEGPRSVGKTTTALRHAKTVFDLDDSDTYEAILADPQRLVRGTEPILIDEWQRFPESWDIVRRAVDADYSPGRFILAGSAEPINPPAHPGAGRIIPIRMRPMSLAERWAGKHDPSVSLAAILESSESEITGDTEATADDYIDEVVSGGFPALRNGTTTATQAPMQGYCDVIVDSDFPRAGHNVRKPETLKNWLSAYAAAVSTDISYEKISDVAASIKAGRPAKETTISYRSTLEKTWLTDPLPAWEPLSSPLSRLTKSPKHQLADPALAACLLGANAQTLKMVTQSSQAGLLFESLIALNLQVYAQAAEAVVFHLRNRGGEREIPFVIKRRDSSVVAVEVKFKQAPDEDDFKHLRWLKEKIGERLIDAVVITAGPFAYRRRQDGIAVVPAALLGP